MQHAIKIIISVALGTCVVIAQDFLLPTVPGDLITTYYNARGIELPHNSPSRVAEEVQSPEFHKLLALILKLPENTSLRYAIGDHYLLRVSDFGLNKEQAKSLGEILQDYVRSRSCGHTSKYAMASLRQRLAEPKPETDGFRAALFENFPNIPRDWVKEDRFQSQAVSSTNTTFVKRFLVIDDRIAWVYPVPLGHGQVWETKVDAQEFDPKLRLKFEAAWQEAERNLEKRGIKRQLGYAHRYEAEVDSILWRKYGIKRMGFRLLNPGINVD